LSRYYSVYFWLALSCDNVNNQHFQATNLESSGADEIPQSKRVKRYHVNGEVFKFIQLKMSFNLNKFVVYRCSNAMIATFPPTLSKKWSTTTGATRPITNLNVHFAVFRRFSKDI